MNKQRGLLAAIMALVMVFAGVAIVASDVDAADSTVAKIGGASYTSLQEAVDAVNSGTATGDIVLHDADNDGIVAGPGVIIRSGMTVTIDFNNLIYKASPGVGSTGTETNAIQVLQNAGSGDTTYLTLKNGTLTGIDNAVTKRLIQNYGTLIMENFTLDGTYLKDTQLVMSNNNGSVTLKGESNIKAPEGGMAFDIYDYSNYEKPASVTLDTNFTGSIDGQVVIDGKANGTQTLSFVNNATAAVNVGKIIVSSVNATVTNFTNAEIVYTNFESAKISGTIDSNIVIETIEKITLKTPINITTGTLTIIGATVVGTEGVSIEVSSQGGLFLDGADVRVPVNANSDAYISITNAKKMSVSGDSTADLGVGYGNTLILADLTVPAGKKIQAWGTVVIEGTVTVQDNDGFHVYKGGNAQIDGALVVEGKATIDGKAVINGSVKVYTKDGGASFNVGEKGEVDVAGTMDVLKGTTKNTTNTLNVEGDLNIEGTLTITGTLEGTVNDMGTIVFNGIASADGATIKVFDGITLNVAAVSGTLTVTDAGIIDTEGMANLKYAISASNEVTLTDVKGVTISVAVDETVKKVDEKYNNGVNEVIVEDVKYRFYTTTMTVNGALADNDSKVARMEIENTLVSGNWFNDADDDKINIITWPKGLAQNNIIVEDLTVGKNVAVEFAGTNIDIAGTVTVVAEDASITIDSTVAYVDLMGSIIIGDDAYYNPTGTGDSKKSGSILEVNGAHYTVQSADMTEYTEYYVTLAAALAATDAYENQIDIIGEITVDEALEIATDKEVLMDKASELTIDVDGTVTVAAGALLDASDAKITVKGMLVIADKETGLDANNGKDMFVYQVVTETDDSITYSGLVLALQNAVSGDTITITGQTAEISESVTIPEGVTLVVPAQSKLTVGSETEDVTLTINGVLDVQRSGILANETASYKETIVINGVLKDGAETANLITTFGMEDFVAFEMKIDGRLIDAYSNLAFASENFAGETVTIYGDVSTGDITFDADDDALTIQFAYITQMVNSTPTAIESSLSIGTMTLVGENITILTIKDAGATPVFGKGFITGTVASAAGSMDLNKVTGITIKTAVDEDVEGTTDLLYVNGTLDGKMTVATGTVTMDDDLTVGADKDDILTIASGATLSNGGKILTVEDAATTAAIKQYNALVIDGTLSIVKGKIIVKGEETPIVGYISKAGKVAVNGVLSISESIGSEINGVMVVKGELIVNDADDKAALLTVGGELTVGSAPSLGAAPSVSGPIAINAGDAFVRLYAGADYSAALFDEVSGFSTAKYTDIKVNGVDYMRVYVDYSGTTVDLKGTLPSTISGYDKSTAKWTSGGKDINETDVVGLYTSAEVTILPRSINLTVSEGVGLQVYIDGLSPESFTNGKIMLGTHTVTIGVESGYDGSKATITVNGKTVANGGTFTLTTDDDSAVIIASGATPAVQEDTTIVVDKGDKDEGMGLTDILLIVLVVLIVIMAIIVALRMMRS